MSVRTQISETRRHILYNIYLCSMVTIVEKTNSYDEVYKWFDYLKSKNHFVKGYVIMPNHLHVLIDFSNSIKSINTIISDGKRFMADEIVRRLQEQNEEAIPAKLKEAVIDSDKDRGKKHQVFERSFDCKPITSKHFFLEKLNYIHNNPCNGVWKLVVSPADYKHSSAKQYISGEASEYLVDA